MRQSPQRLPGNREDVIVASARLEPQQLQIGKSALDAVFGVSHFNHQQAVVRQMIRRLIDDSPHEVETVASSGQSQRGLVPIFVRQAAHRRVRHVRRVADDEVVDAAFEISKEIGLHRSHSVLERVIGDVAFGDRERLGRDVRRVDSRVRKGERSQDR